MATITLAASLTRTPSHGATGFRATSTSSSAPALNSSPTPTSTTPTSTRHVRVQRQRLAPAQRDSTITVTPRCTCTYASPHSTALKTLMPPAHILDAVLDFLFLSYLSQPRSNMNVQALVRSFARTRLVSRVWNRAFIHFVRSRSHSRSYPSPYALLARFTFALALTPHPSIRPDSDLTLTSTSTSTARTGPRSPYRGRTSNVCANGDGDHGFVPKMVVRNRRVVTLNESERGT